jgi:GMP synthase-like glutamine amidotransferase
LLFARHLDEIETLPPATQVLAANKVSAIQAIAAQTPSGGSFHGTQYHPEDPEHTLAVSAVLMECERPNLSKRGLALRRPRSSRSRPTVAPWVQSLPAVTWFGGMG